MKSRLAWLLSAAVWLALSACANSRTADGSSETHFLLLCSDDSCGSGLSCVCGVCTKPCSSDTMCSSLGDGVRCYSVGHQACDTFDRCDVECKDDGDCNAISAEHVCDNGRCRGPEIAKEPGEPPVDAGIPTSNGGSTGSGGASGGGGKPSTLDSCKLSSVIEHIADGAQLMECGQLTVDATSAERADAVACMGNAWESKTPFRLTWALQGTDSALAQGYVGVRAGDQLAVFALSYDSAGTAPNGYISAWTPCALVRVPESCEDPIKCVTCETRLAQECQCGLGADSQVETGCASRGVTPDTVISPVADVINMDFAPPCLPTSCEIDNICYPDGTNTADGCCSCDNGMSRCDQPAWCPGWTAIGKRCASDADCSQGPVPSGLFCRTDFFGERGVCTRDCNFGCPPGFECVADVPDYDMGSIHNVCMRACGSDADCASDPRGLPLDSACDMPPGLSKSYCF